MAPPPSESKAREAAAAATRVQAGVRGRQARAKVKRTEAKATLADASTAGEAADDAAEKAAAATRVQAGIRGRQARAKAKRADTHANLTAATASKPPPAAIKEHTSANLVGAIERHGMGAVIACTPTSEMLEELEAAGVALPDDGELDRLSKLLNEWLEVMRESEGRQRSLSWFSLFKEVDEDGSGDVTFDELNDIIRRKLRKGPSVISDDALKALW